MITEQLKICVVGLGYVGLPLAVEFGKINKTIGFDINKKRIEELKKGYDQTLEKDKDEIFLAKLLSFSYEPSDLSNCNCYIVTVPTPINKFKKPDLSPLVNATKLIGKYLKKGDLVIYESTVYPGCTNEVCVPILEEESKLKFNLDFFCGYSPERINPGDKKHKITDIKKVTSGSNELIANLVDDLYRKIIPAGTHKAKSIKIAEAAKIIENTQRDLNIALINELSIIFQKMNIDTQAVLEAAETKWNFSSYRPGLVGGHCIGVDPYYLTYKSEEIGYKPEIILAGRKINDNMPKYISKKLLDEMRSRNKDIKESKILIMGLSFKENCKDLRNTQVIEIFNYLKKETSKVDIYDPLVDHELAKESLNCELIKKPHQNYYDAIIIALSHDIFKKMGAENIKQFANKDCIVYDLKYTLKIEQSDMRL